jgi:hypothetical protein
MQQQMQQLEAEIARLQVELRQVRQLIGSLIRTEQETTRMMNRYAIGGNPQAIPNQVVNEQMREMEQYRKMQQMANGLYNQMQPYVQHAGQNNPHLGGMNPRHNDPMQRQF